MRLSGSRKRLTEEALLASVGLPILVFVLVQRLGRRRTTRLIRKFSVSLRPYKDRLASELDQWNREITWDEVVEWVLQIGERGR